MCNLHNRDSIIGIITKSEHPSQIRATKFGLPRKNWEIIHNNSLSETIRNDGNQYKNASILTNQQQGFSQFESSKEWDERSHQRNNRFHIKLVIFEQRRSAKKFY